MPECGTCTLGPEAAWEVFLGAHGNATVPRQATHGLVDPSDLPDAPPCDEDGGRPPWWTPIGPPPTLPEPGDDDHDGGLTPRGTATPCTEQRVAVFCDDVRGLANRCRIDLGTHYYLARAYPSQPRAEVVLPPGYEPSTEKSDMWRDFAPEYFDDKRLAWADLRANIKADYQAKVPGLFWDDEHGYMNWAVVHALQLVATGNMQGVLTDEMRALFSSCRDAVRSGSYPLYLSPIGASTAGLLFVTDQGRVACEPTGDSSWKAIALREVSLSPYYRVTAALADYLLWWAWRCHGYWKQTGNEHYFYTGQSCVRLALAECARIGGTLVHEWVHIQGYWPGHCRGVNPVTVAELLGGGAATGAVLTNPLTWVGGAAAVILATSLDVVQYDCVHYTLQHAWTLRACVLNNLPMPVSFEVGASDWNDAVNLIDRGFGMHSGYWDGVFSGLTTIDAVAPVGAALVTHQEPGLRSWYEGIWGFAAVPLGEGCDDVMYDMSVNYDIKSTQARLRFTVPELCSSSGTSTSRNFTL